MHLTTELSEAPGTQLTEDVTEDVGANSGVHFTTHCRASEL